MASEDEIFERIKKENITIHPMIWELLTSNIVDDLFVIMLAVETSILNTKYPKPLTKENAQKIFERALKIKKFLHKLKEAMGKGSGF